jgi:hypothetical protein
MPTENINERNLVSFKDVQIAYLMEGVTGVQHLMEQGKVSKPTIRRALRKFHEQGNTPAEFERWVAEKVGPIGRGRSAPSVGETRSYKVQQIKNTGPFLRLPLDSLGIKKGGVVRVKFEDGKIVVSK